jgi:hypothetical protein
MNEVVTKSILTCGVQIRQVSAKDMGKVLEFIFDNIVWISRMDKIKCYEKTVMTEKRSQILKILLKRED